MRVSRIEALADALARVNAAQDPGTAAYQLRNPLLVRSFAAPGKHETDEEGRRVFRSLVDGYKACLFDLQLKLRARSRAGLKAGDTLTNLLAVYGRTSAGEMSTVVSFVRRALGDIAVSRDTPLDYFLE